jgi:DNA-binding winged helix-turn-helix (wHTH) protein/Tol biopolymer transport system component
MPGKIRFGVYELDRDAMELRRHGAPIRLQEQPFRVLAMLAERPGEVISREQLQEKIWGNTFVDFDQSLNKAVNRVREALNDNAGTPQYIETVPRRGYRFIAPVAAIPGAEVQPPAPATELNSTEPPRLPTLPNLVSDAKPASPEPGKARISTIAAFATAALLVGVTISAALLWRRPEKSTAEEAKRITSAASCCATLSRDGKLLAYASGIASGVSHIWVQQTAGGEAIQVTRGSDWDGSPDFSPDGTHIAFASTRDEGGIFIVPTFSGEPKLLATSGDEPLFSPDGKQILYLDGTDAMIVSVDTGKRTSLSLNREFLVHGPMLWSPDGNQIIFYGVSKREPDKPDKPWIASLAADQPRLLRLPGAEQGEGGGLVRAWGHGKEGAKWIIYSLSNGEVWKVLRVGVSAQGQLDGTPEQLISGTGHLGYSFSVAQDGRLMYEIVSHTNSIYEIPTGNRGEKTGPTLQLPLPEGDFRSPSVSRDGRWMAYDSSVLGKSNLILLRDFASGSDRVLDEMGRSPGSGGETSISPDGSKVIFERDCKTGKSVWGTPLPCGFMVPAAGGEPEQVCELCTARGFSSNGSIVLIQKYNRDGGFKPPNWIAALDLTSRTEKEFLRAPDKFVFHAFFSWDDRWVAFKAFPLEGVKTQIMIAPVRNGVAGKEAEWIGVTDGRYIDDKPQFSPDGNTVYFTSTRDGYLCIWAQKLDPVTKRPVGEPFGYEHFHNSAGRDGVTFWGGGGGVFPDLSVARDKMLIALPQFRAEVWMTQFQ